MGVYWGKTKPFADLEGVGCWDAGADAGAGCWGECVDVDVKDKGKDVMSPSEEFQGCQR